MSDEDNSCDGCEKQLTSTDRRVTMELIILLYEGDEYIGSTHTSTCICEECYADGKWKKDLIAPAQPRKFETLTTTP